MQRGRDREGEGGQGGEEFSPFCPRTSSSQECAHYALRTCARRNKLLFKNLSLTNARFLRAGEFKKTTGADTGRARRGLGLEENNRAGDS